MVFYGDKNNWWATYAYWVLQLVGHKNAKVMDGGRLKWEQEGKELTREVKQYAATSYSAPERDDKSIRIFVAYQGTRHRETLTLAGVPMPPTPANMKYARRVAQDVRKAIQQGSYVVADYFPDSPRAAVGTGSPSYAPAWL